MIVMVLTADPCGIQIDACDCNGNTCDCSETEEECCVNNGGIWDGTCTGQNQGAWNGSCCCGGIVEDDDCGVCGGNNYFYTEPNGGGEPCPDYGGNGCYNIVESHLDEPYCSCQGQISLATLWHFDQSYT